MVATNKMVWPKPLVKSLIWSAVCLALAAADASFAQAKSQSVGAKATPPGQGRPPASSVKLYGQVDELLSACANAGVEISSTTLPARIQKVRLGSPAFYAGLQDNDVILKGALDNGRLHITFRRGAAIYAIDLATQASADTPPVKLKSAAGTATADTSATTLTGGADKDPADAAWKKLKKYDIVMVIDKSGSMSESIDTTGVSKWDWLSRQMSTFATQSAENTGRQFTIVTFSSDFSVRHNCTPADVVNTFTSIQPGGGTNLNSPLENVFSEYWAGPRTNPLLVVVLTDGMPESPNLVEQSIINTTNRMGSPDQVKVVFFLIGSDQGGAALIRLLDIGLQAEGARYDIVDSNSFARLQQVGLKSALYETFAKGAAGSGGAAPQGNDLQAELAAVRKQLEAARASEAQQASKR
jgi:Mg-chelatase subunit ChlD